MKSRIGDGGRAETGYGNGAGSPIDALVFVGRRWVSDAALSQACCSCSFSSGKFSGHWGGSFG